MSPRIADPPGGAVPHDCAAPDAEAHEPFRLQSLAAEGLATHPRMPQEEASLRTAFRTPSDSGASSRRRGSSTVNNHSPAPRRGRRPHARGVSGRMATLHVPRLAPRPDGRRCAAMAGAATLVKGIRQHPARRCLPRRRSSAAPPTVVPRAARQLTAAPHTMNPGPAMRQVRCRGRREPWCPGRCGVSAR